MTKFFIDTEFIESGPEHPIYLMSIGIIDENNREYYAVVDPFEIPLKLADPWVKENVIKHLDFSIAKPKKTIAQEIIDFMGKEPTVYGYYSDYDWVVLCQLYGAMISLPKTWPMYCLDIKQIAVEMGNPKLPELPNKIEHNALWDAREMKYRYDYLMNLRAEKEKRQLKDRNYGLVENFLDSLGLEIEIVAEDENEAFEEAETTFLHRKDLIVSEPHWDLARYIEGEEICPKE